MGKNRVWTDALREVKGTMSRFLSLLLLSALSVAFLSGLRAIAPDMKHSADRYLDETNTMDLHILSTLGLTEDDLKAVEALPETETVEGAYTVDALLALESGDMILKTVSYREGGLNQPRLIEGRMPKRADECLLDARLLTDSLHIGDKIALDPGEDMEGALRYDAYTIVGTAESPLFISMDRGTTTLGAGRVGAFVLIPEGGYDLDYYTDLYATVPGARELNAYSDEYDDLMEGVTKGLEHFGDGRADARYDEVIGEANEKLADAEKELADAEKEVREKLADARRELRDARKELDDGWQEYYDGVETFHTEIADAEQKLADGEQELVDALQKLQDGEQEYEDGLKEWEDGKEQYEDGLSQYRSGAAAMSAGAAQLEEGRVTLQAQQDGFDGLVGSLVGILSAPPASLPITSNDELLGALAAEGGAGPVTAAVDGMLGVLSGSPPPGVDPATLPGNSSALLAAKAALDDGWAQYNAGKAQMDAGGAALSSAWYQLQDAKRELDEGEQKLRDARQELDDGWVEYAQGLDDLAQGKLDLEEARMEGQQELEDAEKELKKGEKEYKNGLKEYEDGRQEAEDELADARQKLNDARRDVADIKDCKWYILDRNTNVGFVTYGQDGQRMAGLANVFPLIFFLVAALVCLTTMTRMVEEQRIQIGGMKAMGYGKGAIALKYVGYGFASGLIGGLVGLALGITVIPLIIYNAWCIIYALPGITFLSQPFTAVLSVGASTAVLTLSALAACLSTLTAVPAQLMRPKAPPAGKRVLLERIPALWSKFSFNQKVTLRNLLRYKKRFFMTLAGIAGCTALIVVGFGLRDSLFEIMGIQYEELTHYNVSIAVADDLTQDERSELVRVLDRSGEAADYLLCTETAVTGETDRYSLSVTVVTTEKAEDLTRFCTFRTRQGHETVPFAEDSVLISEKTAYMLGLDVGDSLTLVSGDERYTATVTGIVEHYVQHYIYTTDAMYEKIFGQAPEGNSYWVICSDSGEDAVDDLASRLVNLSGVNNLTRITTMRETMMGSLESVDYAVIVIIIAAAALAFVVLYNLTNINITERMRELATLKVLGFYDGELSAYVYRENVILTVIGAVLGLFLGKALLMYIIHTVEIDMVMFGRQIKPLSYLLGALFTGAFSVLVNLAAHRKLKQLDMVESLKTVE